MLPICTVTFSTSQPWVRYVCLGGHHALLLTTPTLLGSLMVFDTTLLKPWAVKTLKRQLRRPSRTPPESGFDIARLGRSPRPAATDADLLQLPRSTRAVLRRARRP